MEHHTQIRTASNALLRSSGGNGKGDSFGGINLGDVACTIGDVCRMDSLICVMESTRRLLLLLTSVDNELLRLSGSTAVDDRDPVPVPGRESDGPDPCPGMSISASILSGGTVWPRGSTASSSTSPAGGSLVFSRGLLITPGSVVQGERGMSGVRQRSAIAPSKVHAANLFWCSRSKGPRNLDGGTSPRR